MATKPKVSDYTNMDAYILDVITDLHMLRHSDANWIAVNATLLICNMGLDHTAPSPQMCRVLNTIRNRLLKFEIETD